MIFDILKLIVTILKVIYCIIIAIFTYLYDFNSTLMRKVLENLNIYGSIENLDKYYEFKKEHTNGVALFTHTSYLDGLILATELQEAPSFVCLKKPLEMVSILHNIAKKWKCLIIEPNQNNSKVITETILERNKNDPLLLIAPTGDNLSQENEFELNEFKTGPFISLSPILPILISYSPHIYVKKNDTQIKSFIDILNIEKLTYKVKILDPIYPEKGDKDAANAILDKAGYKKDANGVRMKAVLDIIPYGEDWRRAGEYLKQAMGDIGIQLELRYEDVPTWLKRVYHNYDFEMNVNYFYQLPDPVLGVHRHYGTDQIRKGTHFVNSSRYSNPKLDALLDSGAGEPDAGKRTAKYKEIQQILAEDMPVVNLFELEFLVVYNTKLKGVYDSAMGAYGSFREGYLD